MSPQDEVQLKVLAINAAQGDIAKAETIFAWFARGFIENEVRRQVKAYIDSLQVNSAP